MTRLLSFPLNKVGQVGNLRPIGNRPGPRKLLRLGYEARMHGVHFNVSDNSVKLGITSNQSIIAFILPKGPATAT